MMIKNGWKYTVKKIINSLFDLMIIVFFLYIVFAAAISIKEHHVQFNYIGFPLIGK